MKRACLQSNTNQVQHKLIGDRRKEVLCQANSLIKEKIWQVESLFRFTLTAIVIVMLVSIFNINSFGQAKSKRNIAVIQTNVGEDGKGFEIYFQKSKSFDKPTFAFWIEDSDGKYLQTLYVTNYLATGVYGHAQLAEGKPRSKPGPAKRPSSLPYWLHKRNVRADGVTYLPTPDKPVPDAITGATPKKDFLLKTVATGQLPRKFKLLMEINQAWDFNSYWNKDLYPGEFDYSYSCQPALVYSVDIDLNYPEKEYKLACVGHSDYAGKTGTLFPDISTFTTALDIVKEIKVVLK